MLKSGLVNSSAVEVVEGLRRGDVSPLDCLDALEVRISEVDGRINALPTLCFERARAHARALMQKPVAERGVLAGLPVPIKDLTDVEGVRSTHGSPIFANVDGHSDDDDDDREAPCLVASSLTKLHLVPSPCAGQ